jgi:hypothetical protein
MSRCRRLTIASLQGQIAAVEQMIEADDANIVLVRKANALGGSTALAKVSADSQLEQDRRFCRLCRGGWRRLATPWPSWSAARPRTGPFRTSRWSA